jgi:hypothetical protein
MAKAGTILIGEHAQRGGNLYVVTIHNKIHSIWETKEQALQAKEDFLNQVEENPWFNIYEVPINTTPTIREPQGTSFSAGIAPFVRWSEIVDEIPLRQDIPVRPRERFNLEFGNNPNPDRNSQDDRVFPEELIEQATLNDQTIREVFVNGFETTPRSNVASPP